MTYPLAAEYRNNPSKYRGVKAVKTGECRKPKRGEWYLSGSITEAYQAPRDLTYTYYIAHLVRVRTRTVEEIEGPYEEESEVKS